MRPALLLLAALLAGCASALERELVAVNERAKLAPVPPGRSGNCTAHVEAVQRELEARFPVLVLRSSSPWMSTRHVSALVLTPQGAYVLDNGALQQERDVFPLLELDDSATVRVVRARCEPGRCVEE